MAALAALLITFHQPAHANSFNGLGPANGYNVFVFGNFSEYNTDAQGRVAVGGNFAPAGGGTFTVGSALTTDGAGIFDLVVGGSMTNSGGTLGGGDLFVGGNLNWTNPTLPHNAYVNGNVTNTGGGSVGGTISYTGTYSSVGTLNHTHVGSPKASPINFVTAQTTLDSLSAALAAESSTGTVTQSGSTYTLTGTKPTVNVFNLTNSDYSNSSINISAPAGSTVIVNVAGTSDTFTNGQISFTGVTASNVLFNFSSSTALSVSSFGFNGSILAPYASYVGANNQMNGQLIAYSAQGTTQFDLALFTGALPADISAPEPSSWLLAGSLVLVGLSRRRKR